MRVALNRRLSSLKRGGKMRKTKRSKTRKTQKNK